jgi:hypothetical protein
LALFEGLVVIAEIAVKSGQLRVVEGVHHQGHLVVVVEGHHHHHLVEGGWKEEWLNLREPKLLEGWLKH